MPSFRTIDDLDVSNQRVFIRVDMNVPLADGIVTDATRIERVAPTIKELAAAGAVVVVGSHLGRPKGNADPEYSLQPLVAPLAAALGGMSVEFVPACVGPDAKAAIAGLTPGAICLLENLRFEAGEEANEPAFADSLAELADLYVDDAFSCAHRAHASIVGLAQRLPSAAGRLMQFELEMLARALETPERPILAIVGGNKISTKLGVLVHLSERVDYLVVAGAMANTFLAAEGIAVGKSLFEDDMLDTARETKSAISEMGCELILPSDGVVANALAAGVETETVAIDAIPDDQMVLDIGPASVRRIQTLLGDCKTLVWNGPLGAFETPPFQEGTAAVAQAAATRTGAGKLLTVAGGGDTMAALSTAGVYDDFSYISTAGGAFLEWLEGRQLPGIEALRNEG